MTTQSFSATEDELELAAQILVSRGCNADDGVLQGDQVKEVFNRSALPFATLRVVWNLANENGNGVLSIHELAKALRLIGWVQAGELLSEKLLTVAGPLPTLDGITNIEYQSSRRGSSPQITVFPAVSEDEVRESKAIFWQAGPVNGFLSEDKIMNVFMSSDLSYEDIREIIKLVDRNARHAVDFTEFACGRYLVKALQSSQLHSLPSTIPRDLFDQFKEPSGSQPQPQPPPQPTYRPPSTHPMSYLPPPPQPAGLSPPKMSNSPSPSHQPSSSLPNILNDESEISQHDKNMFELYFRKLDGQNKGHLDRETFDEFVSVYRVPAADLDRIWGLATLAPEGIMKSEEFTIAMHLVKQRSAGEEIPASLPLSILPPSLRTRRHTLASSSLSQKASIKKPPPPVPPKRRDSLIKSSSFSASAVSHSLSVSPPLPPLSSTNPFRQPTSHVGSIPKPPVAPREKSPFEDPKSRPPPQSLPVNGFPRPQSSPPSSPPIANNNGELLEKSKDEVTRLSRQIEVLLGQLEERNELRAANDALRVENDIYKTQAKDMERMMTDILTVNESESAGSQEKYAQDITRLVGDLAEKEAQCEDQERRLRALTEEEKELRRNLRESDATIARHVAESEDYRRTISSQQEQIGELNTRMADMSKVLSDEPESNRHGTTSNRELRVLIRDVTRENDSLKSEVRDMHRSMEQLLLSTKHARHDEMELENRTLKKNVSELEMMVTQLQTSVGFSSSSVKNHPRPSSSSSRSENADALARENERLRSQLQDGKRAFVDFRSSSETRTVEMQQQIEELTKENNRLKVDIHEAREGRREDGSVPPPAYDDAFVSAE